MTRYFVGRLLQASPSCRGQRHCLPAVPRDFWRPALAILGDRELLSHSRACSMSGLDRSLVEQYLSFVSNALHGQFGTPATDRTDVGPLTFARAPVSMAAIVMRPLIVLLIMISMVTLAASRRGGLVDQAVRFLFMVILGVPAFWSGLLLALGLAGGAQTSSLSAAREAGASIPSWAPVSGRS